MLKIPRRSAAFLVLLFIVTQAPGQTRALRKVSIVAYGARPDQDFDNAKAITDAINNADTIIIPKGHFRIKRQMVIRKKSYKTIISRDAVITNADNSAGTLFFDNCDHISIIGGTWARASMPDAEGKTGNEHTLTFETCQEVLVKNVLIDGSPQMGICMMNVIGAGIIGNQIRNCFRDGIYAHYSVNLKYINNKLNNIKDDAMSVHDYGIVNEKGTLIRNGYQQAGHVIVSGNITTHTYQGFSSIGCADMMINNNRFANTVNAGIAVFNSEHLFPGYTSQTRSIRIRQNKLEGNGYPQLIMGKRYENQGQLSSGRSALYVAVNDRQDFISHPVTRLSDVSVTGNMVDRCAVNGVYLAQIDGLIFKDNRFSRCNLVRNAYATQTIEISACTKKTITNNIVR